jgi:hypothetical protein
MNIYEALGIGFGFLVTIGSFVGMFLWSRSDIRGIENKIDSLVAAIHLEMKDFHGRLCAIEAGKKNSKKES